MNILFISGTKKTDQAYLDASTRYRCYHVAEAIEPLGHRAEIVAQTSLQKTMLSRYDVYIFHRPRYDKHLKAIIQQLKYQNKLIIADYDDLIFDQETAKESPQYQTGRCSERTIERIHQENEKAFTYFDYFFCSTKPLATEVLKKKPNSHIQVIHNGLSQYWLSTQKHYPQVVIKKQQKILTYLPGTHSHDHDFKIVEEVLTEFIHRNPNITLRIVGDLRFNTKKFPQAQLELHPHQPYTVLPRLISDSWITIAPLKVNQFNRCKSGLKFFESAVLGVPLIATPIPDLERFHSQGLYLVKNKQEWQLALENLKKDGGYHAFRKNLQKYTLNHCMAEQQTDVMIKTLQRWLINKEALKKQSYLQSNP